VVAISLAVMGFPSSYRHGNVISGAGTFARYRFTASDSGTLRSRPYFGGPNTWCGPINFTCRCT
jgi:hypothetical protein